MFTSIVGNVFGFKALRALRLEDLRIPTAYTKNFPRTTTWDPSLSAKNYGRAVYECLRGGLDFTKDDENVNSQPFMRWRDRFLFCAEAIYKAQAETGEIKGHYLNATAVIDRQKNHGMHFRVLAKALRLSGGDHIHAGTVVGKLEGERDITLGFVDLLRDDFIEKDRSRGIYFTQDWVSLPGVLPVASGGIHVWHMPALTEIFGDDSVLQFGGGTLGHPWGNAPGAVANRVALEACVKARNEGRDLAREGNEIIREASKWSPELAAACEVWKEIKFEFEAMDTLGKKALWKKLWFNSMLSKGEFEYRCGLSKSMDRLGPIKNTSVLGIRWMTTWSLWIPLNFIPKRNLIKNRIDSYQRKTGLTEAVQTGTGQLNGIPIAIGVMDFQFMGGSMGSVVGEKITRLISMLPINFYLLFWCVLPEGTDARRKFELDANG
ncbi:hypothetical protein Pint_20961 [Pistacia integerrima]|uniref:Uncharacterized protein n=1 Tax=Pistacia integerrima TaxID=434235 RepID=A0ACC0XDU0_9ROSI|nr:hypothetical protein Pint_20961 [Pistacia integerrima]